MSEIFKDVGNTNCKLQKSFQYMYHNGYQYFTINHHLIIGQHVTWMINMIDKSFELFML